MCFNANRENKILAKISEFTVYASFFIIECGDGKCEDLEGENCDVCPADCGNCPLEAWQLALIGVGVALILGAAIGVLIVRQLFISVGAKLRYMGYFASLLHPQKEKVGYYFQSGTCLGALETHVLLSFLWSTFCKWPVINVTNIENKSTQNTRLKIYFIIVSMNLFEV